MVEFIIYNIKGERSSIVNYKEIIDIFIKNQNILVKWIYCNQTWGIYDFETKKWNGAVGKVREISYNICNNLLVNEFRLRL